MSLPDLIRRWQYGWGLARGLTPAEDVFGANGEPAALRVTLNLPGRYQEYLPFDASAAREFAELVATARRPSWVSVVGHDPQSARLAFTAAGLRQIGTDDSLMSITLTDHPVCEVPGGYTLETSVADSVIHARVTGPDGKLAARGMTGVYVTDAISHGIATEPRHRRRGLGSVVMSGLCQTAIELGADTGLLVAVPEGRRLYTSLGWTNEADFVTGGSPTA